MFKRFFKRLIDQAINERLKDFAIDYDQLAGEVCYSELADHIDKENIQVELDYSEFEIDYNELNSELDYSELADHISGYQIARH